FSTCIPIIENNICSESNAKIIEFINQYEILDENKLYDVSYQLHKLAQIQNCNLPLNIYQNENKPKSFSVIKSNTKYISIGRKNKSKSLIISLGKSDSLPVMNFLVSCVEDFEKAYTQKDKYGFIYDMPINLWSTNQISNWLEFMDLS